MASEQGTVQTGGIHSPGVIGPARLQSREVKTESQPKRLERRARKGESPVGEGGSASGGSLSNAGHVKSGAN